MAACPGPKIKMANIQAKEISVLGKNDGCSTEEIGTACVHYFLTFAVHQKCTETQ